VSSSRSLPSALPIALYVVGRSVPSSSWAALEACIYRHHHHPAPLAETDAGDAQSSNIAFAGSAPGDRSPACSHGCTVFGLGPATTMAATGRNEIPSASQAFEVTDGVLALPPGGRDSGDAVRARQNALLARER
jgi:hypothetical protein